MQYKILVIDDNKSLLEAIKEVFKEENVAVITATDGETGIEKAIESKPDVIILDLNLPDIDGYKVYRVLKKEKTTSNIPIIFLTGYKITKNDIVRGLEEGACDYIIKPFDNRELIARVNNCFKWLEYKSGFKEVIKQCGMEMDIKERKVKIKGKPVNLTRIEFDLLHYFIRNKGKLLTHKNILETVWGYEDSMSVHTLETHVSNLKRKIGQQCAQKIQTIRKFGYKLLGA
jgi:two-component system, OmpR family, response regulator ArlR